METPALALLLMLLAKVGGNVRFHSDSLLYPCGQKLHMVLKFAREGTAGGDWDGEMYSTSQLGTHLSSREIK